MMTNERWMKSNQPSKLENFIRVRNNLLMKRDISGLYERPFSRIFFDKFCPSSIHGALSELMVNLMKDRMAVLFFSQTCFYLTPIFFHPMAQRYPN